MSVKCKCKTQHVLGLWRLLVAAICVIFILGCNENTKTQVTKKPKEKLDQNAIAFNCAKSEDCATDTVGVIHFGEKIDKRAIGPESKRCIASKVATNRVLTSLHCIQKNMEISGDDIRSSQVYFSLPNTSYSTRISAIHLQSEPTNLSAKNNYIIFELESSTDGQTQHPHFLIDVNYQQSSQHEYDVFTAEEIWDNDTLRSSLILKKSEKCKFIDKPIFFPYSSKQRSETFAIYGCDIYEGSVGSPIVYQKNKIAGVLQSRVDTNAIFDFVAKIYTGLIDWNLTYARHFGIVASSSCFFKTTPEQKETHCLDIGSPNPEISQFPNSGYELFEPHKKEIANIFKQSFSTPYGMFEWQVEYEMIVDNLGEFYVEATMKPFCYSSGLFGFLASQDQNIKVTDIGLVEWELSGGFLRSRILLNNNFQIVPDTTVKLKVENFKIQLLESFIVSGQTLALKISDPFIPSEVRKYEVPACHNLEKVLSWQVLTRKTANSLRAP